MSEYDPPQNSGFLHGVFSFVSREFEGFITTATGRTLQVSEDQRAGRPITTRLSPRPSSPSPPLLPPTLRRRPSISMPGSLYPRSPSLVPDDGRRVRFVSSISSPVQDIHDAEENVPGPSRKASSVKAAVHRFNTGGDDADPSILLPAPHTSPVRVRTTVHLKGKARAIEPWDDPGEGDNSGEVRVRGKERELMAAREEQQRHERQREKEGAEKEAEETETEKSRDKERIRALEEEIARLKEEVGSILPSYFSHC